MGITGDTGDARNGKVERLNFIPSLLHEGHEEGAETAVHMHADLVLLGHLCQRWNVVNDAVWEVGCRTDQRDGVSVDGATRGLEVGLS